MRVIATIGTILIAHILIYYVIIQSMLEAYVHTESISKQYRQSMLNETSNIPLVTTTTHGIENLLENIEPPYRVFQVYDAPFPCFPFIKEKHISKWRILHERLFSNEIT